VLERRYEIVASDETILLVIKFKITGNLRFLSHAEMLNLFQRACARAGISLRYSQGFNPRPRLSLPLPRTVGVASDDDLLCIKVRTSTKCPDVEQFKTRLAAQLPAGCQLLTVDLAQPKTSFQPCAAAYVLQVRPELINRKLKSTAKRLLASKSLNIHRRIDERGNLRDVDVRPFVKSIEFDDKNIVVESKITPAGTIRLEEVLKLLELDIEALTAPLRRTNVQWKIN